jgi:hypothetical protein
MTEDEWRTSKDPVPMSHVALTSTRATERVLRLYLAAFWGWQSHRLRTAAARERLAHRVTLIQRWAAEGTAPPEATDDYASSRVVFFDPDAKRSVEQTASAPSGWGKRGCPAIRYAAMLFREVFGPTPFREIAANPEWLTTTVLALVDGIYDEQAFDRMPILADALQDAGCDNEDILNHCLSRKAIHVRGCWVVDSLRTMM